MSNFITNPTLSKKSVLSPTVNEKEKALVQPTTVKQEQPQHIGADKLIIAYLLRKCNS